MTCVLLRSSSLASSGMLWLLFLIEIVLVPRGVLALAIINGSTDAVAVANAEDTAKRGVLLVQRKQHRQEFLSNKSFSSSVLSGAESQAPATAEQQARSQVASAALADGSQATAAAKSTFAEANALREAEERAAEKLNARLRGGSDPWQVEGLKPLGNVADIYKAANADMAKEAAERKAWKAARASAKGCTSKTGKEEAQGQASKSDLLNPPSTLRQRAARAAAEASAPYLHEIVKMQAAIEEYNATAKRLADEEAEQRRIAESLRKEAVNLYKAWGITGEIVDDHDWDRRIASRKADLLMSASHAHLKEAQFLSEQREKVLGREGFMNESIPAYQEYADRVAASAAYYSNPAWAPVGYAQR